MLIVYQSLESTGTKQDLPSTFITGNSFKRGVHNSLQPSSSLTKSRVWDDTHGVVFTTSTLPSPFATRQQSDALSKKIKALGAEKMNRTSLEILAKVVERIVDNASACTRPPGLVRPYVRPPDIIVLGEIYATGLLDKVVSGYVVCGGIDPTRDARHRFTVLVRTGVDGLRPAPGLVESYEALFSVAPGKNANEESKCMMIKVRGWIIACVHTPNSICNNHGAAAKYLDNNAQRFGPGSKLDLVMGDTNQASSDTVKSYMNGAYNRELTKYTTKKPATDGTTDTTMVEEVWEHSIMPGRKQVVRGYTNYEVSGTNSVYDTHFDIACTSHAVVRLTGIVVHATQEDTMTHAIPTGDSAPAFLFHGLTDKFIDYQGLMYAYSDHNGVIVEVLRDKEEHRETREQKRRRSVVDDFQRKKRKLEEPKKT